MYTLPFLQKQNKTAQNQSVICGCTGIVKGELFSIT